MITTDKLRNLFGFLTLFVFLFLWDQASTHFDFRPIILIWILFYLLSNHKFNKINFLIPTIIVSLHTIFICILFRIFPTQKTILSILVFFIFNLYTVNNYRYLTRDLIKGFYFFFIINFIVQILEIFGFLDISTHAGPYLMNIDRRTGLLNEPSHLAIIYAPFFATFFLNFKKFHRYFKFLPFMLGISSLILAVSNTLIFFVSVFFIFLLSRKINKNMIGPIVITFITLLFLISINIHNPISFANKFLTSLDYLLDYNFNIAPITNDISVLVFFSNFNTVLHSLYNFPLGVGFNNYQFARDLFVLKMQNVDQIYPVSQLNREDGSSNLFKLFVEFGFLLIPYLYLIYNRAKKIFADGNFFGIFCFFSVVITIIRGIGYFNGFYIVFILYMYFYPHVVKKA